jgi:hypothetical protein
MGLFRRKKGSSATNAPDAPETPPRKKTEFEVKLKERLNGMPKEKQYMLVKIGMLVLVIFIVLRLVFLIIEFIE